MTLQNPELFKPGDTPTNLKWLSEQVEAEANRQEREPWKVVGTLKVAPVKEQTLIKSIHITLMEAESLLKFAVTKDEQEVLLTVVIQLPEGMQYLNGHIQ